MKSAAGVSTHEDGVRLTLRYVVFPLFKHSKTIYLIDDSHLPKPRISGVAFPPSIKKKRGVKPLFQSWSAGIRTPIGRSRVGSPTIERHSNVLREMYNTLSVRGC